MWAKQLREQTRRRQSSVLDFYSYISSIQFTIYLEHTTFNNIEKLICLIQCKSKMIMEK